LLATAAGKKSYRDAEAAGTQTAKSLMRVLDFAQCQRLARELHELRGKIEAHQRSNKSKIVHTARAAIKSSP
jgi:hypothetical protein